MYFLKITPAIALLFSICTQIYARPFDDFIDAISNGNVKKVMQLLSTIDRSDLNSATPLWSNDTPLMVAIKLGHFNIAQLLIAAGADIKISTNPYGMTPLSLAARKPLLSTTLSVQRLFFNTVFI